MMKAMKFALLPLAMAGGSSAAIAGWSFQDYDVYGYTFYDDAAHSNVIGYGQTRCDGRYDYSGSYYMRWGSQSSYYDQDPVGICTERGLEVSPY